MLRNRKNRLPAVWKLFVGNVEQKTSVVGIVGDEMNCEPVLEWLKCC